MKLLILGKIFSDQSQDLGIYQKVLGIQDGFNQLDVVTDVLSFSSDGILLNNQLLKSIDKSPSNWYFFNSYFDDIMQSISFKEYDAIWIRHHFYGGALIKFIKEIKQINSNLKVLYELPTYPYLHEFKVLKRIPAAYIEFQYKRSFNKHIDRIITYSGHQEIYGTKTIQINNGINTSLYKTTSNRKIESSIKLVAIGNLWNWFGLDRLLKGLQNYQGQQRITLDIIGDGVEMLKLKAFCKKKNLDGIVTFHGWKDKDEIDSIILSADLGIGTLAIHRKKVAQSSSLKHREYAARGIPFIYGGSDEDFDNSEFIYNINESEEAIDLVEVIRWRKALEITSECITFFAKENLDWQVQLNDIVSYLRSQGSNE